MNKITLDHLAAHNCGPEVLDRNPVLVKCIHEMFIQGHYFEMYQDGQVTEVFLKDVDDTWETVDGKQSMQFLNGDGTWFATLIAPCEDFMGEIRKAGQLQFELFEEADWPIDVKPTPKRAHVCKAYLKRGFIYREDVKSKKPTDRVYRSREETETEKCLNGIEQSHYYRTIRPAVYSKMAGAELAYRKGRLALLFPGSMPYHGEVAAQDYMSFEHKDDDAVPGRLLSLMVGKGEDVDKSKARGTLWLFPTKSLAINLPEGASLVWTTKNPDHEPNATKTFANELVEDRAGPGKHEDGGAARLTTSRFRNLLRKPI